VLVQVGTSLLDSHRPARPIHDLLDDDARAVGGVVVGGNTEGIEIPDQKLSIETIPNASCRVASSVLEWERVPGLVPLPATIRSYCVDRPFVHERGAPAGPMTQR
jgi:hypothetical protein